MNKNMGKDVSRALQHIYSEVDGGKTFLDWAAARINDAAETSVGRMCQVADITRYQAIELAKALSDAGCGEYVVGRKGWKTRILWAFSLRSIGKAAAGETVDLEELDPELAEDVSDQLAIAPEAAAAVQPMLSIAEAKRRLAETFGVLPDAIEIVIRA